LGARLAGYVPEKPVGRAATLSKAGLLLDADASKLLRFDPE
jgi:hypothetical protein